SRSHLALPPFPTRRSSDLACRAAEVFKGFGGDFREALAVVLGGDAFPLHGAVFFLGFVHDYVLERTRALQLPQHIGHADTGKHQDRKSTRLNSSHVKISYA